MRNETHTSAVWINDSFGKLSKSDDHFNTFYVDHQVYGRLQISENIIRYPEK